MTSAYPLGDRTTAITVSSYCKANGCVGVGIDGSEVVIVDTKADGPVLRLGRREWAALVAGVKAGRLDLE